MPFANTHTFFCCELDCSAEAPAYGGRCDDCFELYINKLLEEHNPPQCEWCHEVFDREHSNLMPSESGRFCGKWCEAGYALANEHTCSGEFNYDRGCYVCDDHDDPRCPQYMLPQKHCADCGVTREETEPELPCDWYCKPCWQTRFAPKKCCSDCGSVSKDGFFPCYRGEEPLCATCEEAWLGPRSPDCYSCH